MALATGDPNNNNQKIVDHMLAFELELFRTAPEKASIPKSSIFRDPSH